MRCDPSIHDGVNYIVKRGISTVSLHLFHECKRVDTAQQRCEVQYCRMTRLDLRKFAVMRENGTSSEIEFQSRKVTS